MEKHAIRLVAVFCASAVLGGSLLFAWAGTGRPEPRLVYIDMAMTKRLADKDAPFPPYVPMLTL